MTRSVWFPFDIIKYQVLKSWNEYKEDPLISFEERILKKNPEIIEGRDVNKNYCLKHSPKLNYVKW